MITLSANDTTITLDDDLLWIDKYKWSSVKQQEDTMADGSVVIQADAQQTGRPITLRGGDDFGWLKRSVLDAVKAFEVQPELQMTLTMHDGVARNVVFTGARLTADQVIDYNEDAEDDDYIATLYFMEL